MQSNDDEDLPFGLILTYFDMISSKWLDEKERPSRENTDDFDGLIELSQDVVNEVIDFGDAERLEIRPLLRLLRAMEGRCSWDDVDQQIFLDAHEHIIVRHQAIERKLQFANNTNPVTSDSESIVQTDGPYPPDGFVFLEKTVRISKPKLWKLLNYLWACRGMTAEFLDLAEPVWDDREYHVSIDMIGSLRRDANNLFKEAGMPLQIKVRRPYVTLYK